IIGYLRPLASIVAALHERLCDGIVRSRRFAISMRDLFEAHTPERHQPSVTLRDTQIGANTLKPLSYLRSLKRQTREPRRSFHRHRVLLTPDNCPFVRRKFGFALCSAREMCRC